MFRVKAFRNAADAIRGLSGEELRELAASGSLRDLQGSARRPSASSCRHSPVSGRHISPNSRRSRPNPDEGPGAIIRAALKGDCHVHSDWSDGGSPIEVMAAAARDLGHEYIVLTDHSPRLTVAHGLSAERLREQLKVVHALNEQLAPFRILTGIEVDILEDGSLDQEQDLLAQLDIVVASVHTKLRMEGEAMTRRWSRRSPIRTWTSSATARGASSSAGGRPESSFEAELVFAAAAGSSKAVEITSPGAPRPATAVVAPRRRHGLQGEHRHGRARARATRVALRTAATAPRSAAYPQSRSSTPWTPMGSSHGLRYTPGSAR